MCIHKTYIGSYGTIFLMPSHIEKLLENIPNEKINLEQLIHNQPWVIEKNHNCIISPDSDGFLCGLLMSTYFNWKIVGFYDGKTLLSRKDIKISECIFLDVEIFNKNIRSIGNHCVIPHNKIYEELGENKLEQCISPGLLRGFDGHTYFRLKYPLGTIHLLLSIIFPYIKIDLPDKGIASLLFPDGLFNVLFNYPENVLTWFGYLDFENKNHPMNKYIYESNLNNQSFSLGEIMNFMREYFIKRDTFGEGIPGRGDHLKLVTESKREKDITLIKSQDGLYRIRDDIQEKIKGFISMNALNCNFDFNRDSWSWNELRLIKFEKQIVGGEGKKYNQTLLRDAFSRNIVSGAQTAGNRFEYSYSDNLDIFNSV